MARELSLTLPSSCGYSNKRSLANAIAFHAKRGFAPTRDELSAMVPEHEPHLAPGFGFSRADVEAMPAICFNANASALGVKNAIRYHVANGHVGKARMHAILHKKSICNPDFTHADIDAMPDECFGCEMGTLPKRKPHKGTQDPRARYGDRAVVVYADAFGETRTPTRGGYQGRGSGFKWAMVFVTRRSRTTAVKLMRKEGDFLSVLKEYLAEYKARHGYYPLTRTCSSWTTPR